MTLKKWKNWSNKTILWLDFWFLQIWRDGLKSSMVHIRLLGLGTLVFQYLLYSQRPCKDSAVLQSVFFVFCFSVSVPSKQKMIRTKKIKWAEEVGACGGRWGPSLPLWPMPGKDYIWWSECSSRIVSCRDPLLQSAPSEHITFYCCLLAGNSFFGSNTPVGLICFFFRLYGVRLTTGGVYPLKTQATGNTRAHTRTQADIYRGKWLFLLAFPEMSSLLSVERCCKCLKLFYSLRWPWPEAPKSLNWPCILVN